ncbi:RAMP superfamily CRISPR-associated protein [Candidatus Venteria ishoeyi]|uniref:RAMP superfamily protein n=1 Tax=Candidatus Venteria ishoeyi TaxID=1899563 RepID=A0A1H6FDJ7_9GAMM|nr:RAMP superfamily CRISPR-associated protein [Candidatus Venteria ishoeyi]SEH08160.1 RAMP superfamily protein [Candidatus Venteria ishoeyi]
MTTLNHYNYQINLTLQAPILSQIAGAKKHGLDTAVLRAADDTPALPGSLIRGNLRHAWCEFEHQLPQDFPYTNIERWLGDESGEGSGDEPRRGLLQFDYQWLTQSKTQAEQQAEQQTEKASEPVQYRIKINDDTGTVDPGALQVIESPFASGDSISFCGTIHCSAISDTESEVLERWLNKAFAYIPALGAMKGSGFGRLQACTITRKQKKIPAGRIKKAPVDGKKNKKKKIKSKPQTLLWSV